MSTIKANTLLHSDGTTTTQPSIPALDQRMAKAWVNWEQSACTVADSYNISSVTDTGVGIMTINFATNLPNTNYVWVASPFHHSGVIASGMLAGRAAHSVSEIQLYRTNSSGTAYEFSGGHDGLVVFGS